MENLTLCPYCESPLTPFNLLENDRHFGVLYSNAKIKDGLAPHGLRCSGKNRHQFGYIGERRVEIDCRFAKKFTEPPDSNTLERCADGLATFIFSWFSWMPLPKHFWAFLRDQRIVPWQVAESWHVFYDPNAPHMTEQEMANLLAEQKSDAQTDIDIRQYELNQAQSRMQYFHPDEDSW